jgi:hypothetical protein
MELGLSRDQVNQLQQIAVDELAAMGPITESQDDKRARRRGPLPGELTADVTVQSIPSRV